MKIKKINLGKRLHLHVQNEESECREGIITIAFCFYE